MGESRCNSSAVQAGMGSQKVIPGQNYGEPESLSWYLERDLLLRLQKTLNRSLV